MTTVGANPGMAESQLFRPYWVCLKCRYAEAAYDIFDEPEVCSQCGYHTFKPEYAIFLSR